jgi:hypothetical protein
LTVKLKGHHFDTIEAIEAESQTVLNVFTKHGFQDAFKKMAAGTGTYPQKGTTSKVMASRPKVWTRWQP